MAAVPYLYKRLRSLGVNAESAEIFADSESSLTMPNIPPLAGGASAATIVTTVNALIQALIDAGAMEAE